MQCVPGLLFLGSAWGMGRESGNSLRANTAEAVSRLHGGFVKAFKGYYRLRDFIRKVRACKTAAEERRAIAKESAAIRNVLKGRDVSRDERYQSLGKLMFIYLLGYPAAFGQVECMKMAANATGGAGRFKDKRRGYLGVSLLTDEEQETLTLITNSLKSDLNSASEVVVAQALTSLALVASAAIARELVSEVDRLLSASMSTSIRKKAAACAVKLVRKDPDLVEVFAERASGLLGDRSHAVVLAGCDLIRELIGVSGSAEERGALLCKFRRLVPGLVRLAQTVQASSFDPEYDIGGVADPLLLIHLLRLLRLLGTGDVAASAAQNELLALLATNTDASKNVGQAVLYEVVLTIMGIESDASLRNLAINTLGRFLAAPDNNQRYVALNLLYRIVRERAGESGKSCGDCGRSSANITNVTNSTNSASSTNVTNSAQSPTSEGEPSGAASTTNFAYVQRHRRTVLSCLSDVDSTIRRKAADLALALVTPETLPLIGSALLDMFRPSALPLVRERERSNEALKVPLLLKLARAYRQHSTSPMAYVNGMIRVLRLVEASNPFTDEIVRAFVQVVGAVEAMHVYATKELYLALTVLEGGLDVADGDEEHDCSGSGEGSRVSLRFPAEGLLQGAFWCFGEFGGVLEVESLCSRGRLRELIAGFLAMPVPGPPTSVTRAYAALALVKAGVKEEGERESVRTALRRASVAARRARDWPLVQRIREADGFLGAERDVAGAGGWKRGWLTGDEAARIREQFAGPSGPSDPSEPSEPSKPFVPSGPTEQLEEAARDLSLAAESGGDPDANDGAMEEAERFPFRNDLVGVSWSVSEDEDNGAGREVCFAVKPQQALVEMRLELSTASVPKDFTVAIERVDERRFRLAASRRSNDLLADLLDLADDQNNASETPALSEEPFDWAALVLELGITGTSGLQNPSSIPVSATISTTVRITPFASNKR
jgi:hypothetical protein